MEGYTYQRNVTDLLSDGITPYERRFGQPFKGPIVPFSSLVEYYPISAKDQSKIHQFGKKVLPGLFLGYALYAVRIWKGDVLVADLEELETTDASEIYSKRLNAKEVIFPQRKRRFHFSDRRWTNQPPWRRSRPENIHLDTAATNSRRKSPWFSWRIREVSSTTSRFIFGCRWSDDYWVSRLVRSLDRFHSIYSIGRKTSRRIPVVRGEINEKTADIQARSFMARTLWENGKECQAEGEAKVVTWKNLNSIRGIYFIDPEDKEFKETIKNARKKLETTVIPAMPCKISKNNQNCGNGDMCSRCAFKIMKKNCGGGTSNKIKTKLACILEADESTRLRMGNSVPNYHEDHVAGKGDNSLQHYNLVHKFIPMPQAMKTPAAKAAVEKEWEKLEKISAWRYSSFCLTDGHLSFEECRIFGGTPLKIQRWYCDRRFRSLCSIHRTRIISISNDRQKSWMSFPDCQVAQDKQLTQYLLIPK